MRLSDLLNKISSSGAVSEPVASEAVSSTVEEKSLTLPEPPVMVKSRHSYKADVSYSKLPKEAILSAAAQLEIPISQNSRIVLNNAREALSKIILAGAKRAEKKDGLWESTLQIVHNLSQLIALDANFCYAVEYDGEEKEWLIPHSMAASLIAMDMAKRVDNIECSIQDIGAAGLLHDIGMACLGLNTVNDHSVKYQEHVAKGLEVLEEMKVPEIVRTIVAQHHERTNGTGYPKSLAGHGILLCSQVLALSETFERYMFRSFHEAAGDGVSHLNYVQATLDEFHSALDPRILKTFISLKGFYPRGVMVELTNRAICLVIKPNEGYPLQPIIRMVTDSAGHQLETPAIIDLRHSALSIVRALTKEQK